MGNVSSQSKQSSQQIKKYFIIDKGIFSKGVFVQTES